ncbi:hypothetical protein FACS1894116_03740 [Betaproteobacteria bacterium]|nr:hypothetical protein FACS1894116_03740 [Betaproteobacteria bacterium]GHT99048.1 hypothetical protein FACS1894154_05420 [Betaproteobacteria bacterium]GHU24892.1 hypothetical protein FACS189488_10540 [Betaproteobacteria bacterium]
MKMEAKLRLSDVFISITDPRQSGKVSHDLVELLVVAANAVLVGADTFAEIEWWAQEKLDWLRGYRTPSLSEQPARRCTATAARHPRLLEHREPTALVHGCRLRR